MKFKTLIRIKNHFEIQKIEMQIKNHENVSLALKSPKTHAVKRDSYVKIKLYNMTLI